MRGSGQIQPATSGTQMSSYLLPERGDQRGAVTPAVDEKIRVKKTRHQVASSAKSVTSKKAGRRTCPWIMFQRTTKIPCLCCGLL